MTRKQFLGSFAAGIAGLGALASGKAEELPTVNVGHISTDGSWHLPSDSVTVTSGRVLQMQEELLDPNNNHKWLETDDWGEFLIEDNL